VARDPRQAVPLHGTYLGPPDAFIGMDINIKVVSVGEERDGSLSGTPEELLGQTRG
jgi:hypothetical protein